MCYMFQVGSMKMAAPRLMVIIILIVALPAFTIAEVTEDTSEESEISWSYLTSIPEDPSGALEHNYIFAETQPWSAMVCPKGTFISQLRYNFLVPGDYIPNFTVEQRSELTESKRQHYHKRITRSEDQQNKMLFDELELLVKDVANEENNIPLETRLDNLMTLWPKVQQMQQKKMEIGILQKYISTGEDINAENLNVLKTYPDDTVITMQDSFLYHLRQRCIESESEDIGACLTERTSTHEKNKYSEKENSEDTDSESESSTNQNWSHRFSTEEIASETQYPEHFGLCGTFALCLGYQSCLFRVSNDFCLQDPISFMRKTYNITITCERDEVYLEKLEDGIKKDQLEDHIISRKDNVVYLKYKPVTEGGSTDYNTTEIRPQEIPEKDVFQRQCPSLEEAKQQGYV